MTNILIKREEGEGRGRGIEVREVEEKKNVYGGNIVTKRKKNEGHKRGKK